MAGVVIEVRVLQTSFRWSHGLPPFRNPNLLAIPAFLQQPVCCYSVSVSEIINKLLPISFIWVQEIKQQSFIISCFIGLVIVPKKGWDSSLLHLEPLFAVRARGLISCKAFRGTGTEAWSCFICLLPFPGGAWQAMQSTCYLHHGSKQFSECSQAFGWKCTGFGCAHWLCPARPQKKGFMMLSWEAAEPHWDTHPR